MQRQLSRSGLLLGLALVLSAVLPAHSQAVAFPRSMAATGDSITRAFNTGWLPYTDNPAASWSTGTDTRVTSHYARLRALSDRTTRTYNNARSGAKMADLNRQMTLAVSQGADYVTVLMGANDVCTNSESTMTSVQTFTAQFRTAMDAVTTGAPKVRVYVVSIPDIHHLWEILHDNWYARTAWWTFGICQSMLANPTSTATADVQRRARVRARNIALNQALESVCAAYRQCLFDDYAGFTTQFSPRDVSTRDYFHPSIAGQAKAAAVTWAAGYWGG
jgi:lysophospholipase L1-like esterase